MALYYILLLLNVHTYAFQLYSPTFSSCCGPSRPIRYGAKKESRLRSSSTPSSSSSSSSSPSKTEADQSGEKPFKIAIIGGGWAGYTAANDLSSTLGNDDRDVSVTLLDASRSGGGGLAGGYRTKDGNRPVEAGIHGFWREYKNTFSIMEEVLLGNSGAAGESDNDHTDGVTSLDDILGDWTPSSLFNSNGPVGVAPVLGEDDPLSPDPHPPPSSISPTKLLQALATASPSSPQTLARLLPPPLDLALLPTLTPRLTPLDRLSGLGLLGSWADFRPSSASSWEYYDVLSASDLYDAAGVTDALRKELLDPLSAVLPMCPAYDCSAAALLSCLHVFALQTRGAFDVRWCRGGIGEKVFQPWRKILERRRGVVFRDGARVASVVDTEGGRYNVRYQMAPVVDDDDGAAVTDGGDDNNRNKPVVSDEEFDAIVFAVGGTAMGKLATASPAVRNLPGCKDFERCRGVTCVAVRMFLKPNRVVTAGLSGGVSDRTELPPDVANAMVDSPVVVCGPGIPIDAGLFEDPKEEYLKETGFCIYDLQRLHDEFATPSPRTMTRSEEGDEDDVGDNSSASTGTAVLEVDFYRADAIASLSDRQIADLALAAVASALSTQKIDPNESLIDVAVVRAYNAVSHFCVGSASVSPGVRLAEGIGENASAKSGGERGKGVYICGDWIDRTGHASWSTEKAVVTGRQAATALAEDFGLDWKGGTPPRVIEVPNDTKPLEALRGVADYLREVAPMEDGGAVTSPWVFPKRVLERLMRI